MHIYHYSTEAVQSRPNTNVSHHADITPHVHEHHKHQHQHIQMIQY